MTLFQEKKNQTNSIWTNCVAAVDYELQAFLTLLSLQQTWPALVLLSLLSVLEKISRLECTLSCNWLRGQKNQYSDALLFKWRTVFTVCLLLYGDAVIRLVSVTWLSSAQRTLETFPTPAIKFSMLFHIPSRLCLRIKKWQGYPGGSTFTVSVFSSFLPAVVILKCHKCTVYKNMMLFLMAAYWWAVRWHGRRESERERVLGKRAFLKAPEK